MKFAHYAIVERILQRKLEAIDGVPIGRLTLAEQRLGLSLPEVLADFYTVAGAAPELQAHNSLRQPEDLEIEDSFLVSENDP